MNRGPGKLFVPGQSGNPGGRPKGVIEVRELARTHTEAAIKALADMLTDEKAPHAARVAAAVALLDRGWGKPLQQVEAKRTPLDGLSHEELTILAEALRDLDKTESGSAGLH